MEALYVVVGWSIIGTIIYLLAKVWSLDEKIKEKKKNNNFESAGICDNCTVPKMINSGDGRTEPFDPILYCDKMDILIEPELLEERRTKCEFYQPKN